MSMRIDIIHKGKILRRIRHDGQVYTQAPTKGSYKLSVFNPTSQRKLAVVTVDGINVVSGEDGDFDGPGYIVGPYETIEIPGWRRDDGSCAAFTFKPEEKSYASKTGRGTTNVGVIGAGCFDEQEAPQKLVLYPFPEHHHHHHHHRYDWPWFPHQTWYTANTVVTTSQPSERQVRIDTLNANYDRDSSGRRVRRGTTEVNCSTVLNDAPEPTKGMAAMNFACAAGAADEALSPDDVGTGYGQEMDFQTTTITFRRATDQPSEILTLRYATRNRLESWGVPINKMTRPERPQPFPASQGPSCPAPADWGGGR